MNLECNMRTYIYIYIIRCLSLLLVVMLMTACHLDTTVHDVDVPLIGSWAQKRAIGFDMHPRNTTRAVEQMSRANHYEFGVFASVDTSYVNEQNSNVMSNYLVAYGPNTAYRPWLALRQSADSVDTSHSNTDWIYNMLGNDDPYGPTTGVSTPMTKSVLSQQISKFWDETVSAYYFYAYTPYMREGDATQPGTMTIGRDADGEYMYFNGLRAFYTDPVVQTGITRGAQTMTGYEASRDIAGNTTELINANEALYAANTIETGSYTADVPLIFKHVNAKIRIGFWEDVPGYRVQLLDLVPENVNITYGSGQPPVGGVVLTPATKEMTLYPQPQTPKTELAPYYSQAQVRIMGISPESLDSRTNFKDIQVGCATDQPSRENLCFAVVPGDTLEESREHVHISPTVYYALPNYESSLAAPRITASEGGGQVAAATGFTAHASFMLIPADNTHTVTVYDARVYIPADTCQWEAGKQYTYIFRITNQSNGVTNPNKPDPTDPSTPWVDPDDPRIPDRSTLSPIVLDGVKVDDYDENSPPAEFQM